MTQSGVWEATIFTTFCVPPCPVLYQVVLGTKDEPLSVFSHLIVYVNDKSSEEAALQSPPQSLSFISPLNLKKKMGGSNGDMGWGCE